MNPVRNYLINGVNKNTMTGKTNQIPNGVKRGFTLMEILVYLAVLTVIFLSVLSFLTWSTKSGNKARAIREVTDNARRAMEIMTYEIREAKSIYTPTSTSTQLSLETSHYLPAGEILTFIDFYLCGEATSTLCLKKESEPPIAITTDRVKVSNLEFLQIATTTPSIQINLKVDCQGQASIDLTSTASLRSY